MFENRFTSRNHLARVLPMSSMCPDCKKVCMGPHKCRILCMYCHDFHLQSELIADLCPVMYPFAKEQQEKHSYQCKNCSGEGSYLEQVSTVRYESNLKFEKKMKEWAELNKHDPQNAPPPPQRSLIHKDVQTKDITCQECRGTGTIYRMVECCKHGCGKCQGDKYIINHVWKKYRKEPVPNQQEFQCSICLDDVKVADSKYVLNCKHEFHPECIFKWIKDGKKCPVCRQHDLYLEGQQFGMEGMMQEQMGVNIPPNIFSVDRLGIDSADDEYSF